MMRAARTLGLAVAVTTSLALGLAPARADMRAQMQAMFDTMVNVTDPGVYGTQRRGEISAGSIATRSRIVNPNLVAFNPPSFRSGCGGIDFFAGSFSFINAEQFVALMRAVAANAVGYAFNLALDQMCPQCMRTIETLQRKIQELNQHFGNSCQLAQGLVNDTLTAMTGRTYGEASIIATAEGIGDIFQSWTATTGQSPVEQVAAAAPEAMAERITGNLVWRALKRSSVASWFVTGGDDQVLSVMMNIAGTVIVTHDPAADEITVQTIAANPDLIESWIEGLVVRYYSCAGEPENGCLTPALATSTWSGEGFARAIFARLTETGGLLDAIRAGGDPSEDQRRLIASLPGATGAMFVRLAAVSDQAAVTFAREASYQLAIELTAALLRELYTAVSRATDAIDDAYSAQVKELLRASSAANEAELARLQRRHGSVGELLALYGGYLDAIQPQADSIARARLEFVRH
jgi:conjugative transfer pilus assembly protein TraH